MKLSKPVKKIIAGSLVCFIFGIGMPVSLAVALPKGGNIAGGQGTISQPTAKDLTINQNTDNLIINWKGFNIGAAESVQFFQPSADSVALNRVSGFDPSRIAGRLSANGQVFISNPSGVIFLPGSQVNVHGLLATTLSISDQDFLSRNYRFYQDPTRSLASILNQGTIKGSYVGLLAPSVVNQGTIVANLGSVALASGKTATLDFIGDDLINFAITEEVEGTGRDANGNVVVHNISNEGIIQATGGQVSLSVRRAGEIVKSVINQEGLIEARSVVNRQGKIFLSGGDNGIVSVTGTLDASGKGAVEKGGTIHVTGENVGLFETAKLDASGDSGGGEILVGGDREGKGVLQNAKATFVDENVSITVDAINRGDGGKLIIFAEDTARIYGDLSARGGSYFGNGGFIETSGKQYIEIFKVPDIGAPNGQGGEWLIDPYNLEVVAGTGFNVTTTSPFSSLGSPAKLDVGLILAALGNGNVTVNTGTSGSEAGNITWNANLDINGLGTTTNRTLFLNAAGSVFFNNNVFDSAPGGDKLNLTFTAGTGILQFNSGANLNTGGGNFFFSSNDIVIDPSAVLNGGLFTILTQNAGDVIGLGTGAGSYSLSDAEMDRITASQINIGNGIQNINVNGLSIDDPLTLLGGLITFTGGASTFGNLTANAGTVINGFANLNALATTFIAGTDINITTSSITSQGSMFYTAPTIRLDSATFNSTNNPFTVKTNGLFVQNSSVRSEVNLGTSIFTFLPFSGGLDLGTGPGILSLLNNQETQISEINVTTSKVIFGDSNTGPVTVNNVDFNNEDVVINSGSTVTFLGVPSTFKSLTINAAGGVIGTFNSPLTTTTEKQQVQQGTNAVNTFLDKFSNTGNDGKGSSGPPPAGC